MEGVYSGASREEQMQKLEDRKSWIWQKREI